MSKIHIIGALVGALLINSTNASAEETLWGWLSDFQRTKEVKPATDALYLKECGECHFAYQPGWLPARSWEKMMNANELKNHFGVNAEFDKGTSQSILKYLSDNSAEKSYYKRSRKIALAVAEGETPLRITEVRYIKRKHKDIPEKMVKGNNEVKSLSFCDKCHTQAGKSVFDEDTVSIPNYPAWED